MKKGSQQMMNTPAGEGGGQGPARRAGGRARPEGARGGEGRDLAGLLAAALPRAPRALVSLTLI